MILRRSPRLRSPSSSEAKPNLVNMLAKSSARRTVLIIAFLFLSCLLLHRVADSLRFQLPLSGSLFAFPSIFPSSLFDNDHSLPDADIMWFRDPFPRFYSDADFEIACDHFLGSSDDIENRPNGGFNHVKSNNRSIEFYKFWYSSRETYPGYHDQDVLNIIKFDPLITDIGLNMRFLDTAFFGGLCEPSKDLNLVCTMHANCCYGLDSKLHDLRIMLQDWKTFLSLPPTLKRVSIMSWNVPQNCSLESLRYYGSPRNDLQ